MARKPFAMPNLPQTGQVWSGRQVAIILGLPYDTFHYWVQKGLIKPTNLGPGPRGSYCFTFSDIVAAAAIKALHAQGISLKKLNKARDELWERIGISLAQGIEGGVIVADHRELFAVLYTFDDAIQIMALLRGGQLVLPLSNLIEEIRLRTEQVFGSHTHISSTSFSSQQNDPVNVKGNSATKGSTGNET